MKFKLIIDKSAQEEVTVVAHSPSDLTEKIESLVRAYTGKDSIVCYGSDDMRRLSFDEIECITVIDRRVIAVDTQGNHYVIRDRLRDLEEILPSFFIRINKSAIANERRISLFETAVAGGVNAVFLCGYREYVSRRCFAQIRRRYEEK